VKQESRFAKEKYYKDNICENCVKNNSRWWKRISKLTGRNKPSNILLTNLKSQSVMRDKDTANYINNFYSSCS
jgi:hypothetical protein